MARKHEWTTNGGKAEAETPTAPGLRAETEQLAYTFYCECGYEHGHDLEHWAEAERRVLEQHQGRGSKGG
ncbi:MAG: DUF2934 domain-containing protein [Nitrospira sp.]|nr:DUF2934 domain-containing protein [Nitrospira sp.]